MKMVSLFLGIILTLYHSTFSQTKSNNCGTAAIKNLPRTENTSTISHQFKIALNSFTYLQWDEINPGSNKMGGDTPIAASDNNDIRYCVNTGIRESCCIKSI